MEPANREVAARQVALARARLGEKVAEVAILLRQKASEIEDYVTAPDASADPLSVFENVSRTLTELVPALKLYELPRITLSIVEAQRALENLEEAAVPPGGKEQQR